MSHVDVMQYTYIHVVVELAAVQAERQTQLLVVNERVVAQQHERLLKRLGCIVCPAMMVMMIQMIQMIQMIHMRTASLGPAGSVVAAADAEECHGKVGVLGHGALEQLKQT
jgi:hypothetical protein